MYIACDENNIRIDISDAQKNNDYYCPICKGKLIIKDGKSNAKHFAHKVRYECNDDWSYDMSEWHRQKQSYFPIENREVILSNGIETHRADILIDNTVIEFQHSKITKEEFTKRNDFYISLGLRIAWVFDVSEYFKSNRMSYLDKEDGLMKWENPMRIFDDVPLLTDDNKDFSLWFSWDANTKNEDIIYKVIKTVKDKNNKNVFSKFQISAHNINLIHNQDINAFFMSETDYINLENNKDICNFKSELTKLNMRYKYKVRYKNKEGEKDECYICPRTNEKSINVHEVCSYCRYCYMVAQSKKNVPLISAIYCCYPIQVQELCNDNSGHECSKVKFYFL